MDDFKTGDQVRLKSGGIWMTVNCRDEKYREQFPNSVPCVWTEGNGEHAKMNYGAFHPDMLTKN